MSEQNEGPSPVDTNSEKSPPKTVPIETSGANAADKATIDRLIKALSKPSNNE